MTMSYHLFIMTWLMYGMDLTQISQEVTSIVVYLK